MDNTEIEDMFAALGPVTIKRLFGGKGVYHRGLIVGIVFRGEMLLKVDDESGPRFLAAGASQWTYEGRRGKTVRMPYWTVPVDAFDDPDELATWVKLAFAAAQRVAAAESDQA